MPVIWQASQRPMYVRTVFVDGLRHAILTPDDPHLRKLRAKQKRPYSSISYRQKTDRNLSRLSHNGDEFEGCLRKLNLVITSDKTYSAPARQRTSHFEPRIEKLNLTDIDQESEEDFVLKSKPQPLNDFESCRSKFNSLCLEMRTLRSNRTSRTEVKENTELSDRVLQWLDLAGKVDLLAPENEATRIVQPRHSWPEIQKRNNNNVSKSKTTVDFKAKLDPRVEICKETVANVVCERAGIDRHDFYVPAPANTIENYARQSRNTKSTPCNDHPHKLKDHVKTKTRDLRRNVQETRQKIVSERNAVEKQYAELVSRKILPEYGKSKKQVHIFMPEAVPTKNDSIISQAS